MNAPQALEFTTCFPIICDHAEHRPHCFRADSDLRRLPRPQIALQAQFIGDFVLKNVTSNKYPIQAMKTNLGHCITFDLTAGTGLYSCIILRSILPYRDALG